MELKVNIDLELDLYKNRNFASLKIQGSEISYYVFKSYVIDKDNSKVTFYDAEEKEIAVVKCEVLRVWQS